MAFGDTFFAFCEQHNIGKKYPDSGFFEITIEEFHRLIPLTVLFDGSQGGLVLGNLHANGGVHMIAPNLRTGRFRYAGEMEGREYLSPPIIRNGEFCNQLIDWNESIGCGESDIVFNFEIPKDCRVINTHDIAVPIIVLSIGGEHFIINRLATRKYINEIIELEKEWGYLRF